MTSRTRSAPVRTHPRWIVLPAALGAALVLVPLVAIVAKVDWPRFGELVTSPDSRTALVLSLQTSSAATLVCILLGVPLGVVLARSRSRFVGVLRPLVLLPLVLPPVVGGIALLYAFGRRGLVGQHGGIGEHIAFTTVAVVLAQAFVALPFLVLAVEGALRTLGTDFEHTAATLGARPSTVLRRITLPLVLPSIASGVVLTFARALGEFGATLTFAGSLAGTTRTLPLEIYLRNETDPQAAVALSLVLLAAAAVIVSAVYGVRSWRR
ncbi:molybdenum ABC transporter permease [Tsukamurella pulmonis]|uniref:Molybdenum transport system permease n=1 Tax=Tsukamurella pulmonis TaxID=47312 RepID=A0A1H1FA47_9ACTN|nr:ABC transporter permease [Tsukamurella pulmonis]KXO88775.1 molybdenum ABC transporter permease [Tsukamurella pulmonis]KXP09270.1 molybdenum ABC transporter permease [Tsukamurella pulmonis]RDH12574.1 molybdate ABC transporter permease subunit [Tsukamurella pulmonis]SDQ97822.1 molybdate transport system permease protein [Tsukamurella pulmonis]